MTKEPKAFERFFENEIVKIISWCSGVSVFVSHFFHGLITPILLSRFHFTKDEVEIYSSNISIILIITATFIGIVAYQRKNKKETISSENTVGFSKIKNYLLVFLALGYVAFGYKYLLNPIVGDPTKPDIEIAEPLPDDPTVVENRFTINTDDYTYVGDTNSRGEPCSEKAEMIFKKRIKIEEYDMEDNYAEIGDKVKGSWVNGHLYYGKWYDSNENYKKDLNIGTNESCN